MLILNSCEVLHDELVCVVQNCMASQSDGLRVAQHGTFAAVSAPVTVERLGWTACFFIRLADLIPLIVLYYTTVRPVLYSSWRTII